MIFSYNFRQLLKRKSFTSPAVYEQADVSGSFTLTEYKKITDLDERINELRACRLTQDEIDLVLCHESESNKDQVGYLKIYIWLHDYRKLFQYPI